MESVYNFWVWKRPHKAAFFPSLSRKIRGAVPRAHGVCAGNLVLSGSRHVAHVAATLDHRRHRERGTDSQQERAETHEGHRVGPGGGEPPWRGHGGWRRAALVGVRERPDGSPLHDLVAVIGRGIDRVTAVRRERDDHVLSLGGVARGRVRPLVGDGLGLAGLGAREDERVVLHATDVDLGGAVGRDRDRAGLVREDEEPDRVAVLIHLVVRVGAVLHDVVVRDERHGDGSVLVGQLVGGEGAFGRDRLQLVGLSAREREGVVLDTADVDHDRALGLELGRRLGEVAAAAEEHHARDHGDRLRRGADTGAEADDLRRAAVDGDQIRVRDRLRDAAGTRRDLARPPLAVLEVRERARGVEREAVVGRLPVPRAVARGSVGEDLHLVRRRRAGG